MKLNKLFAIVMAAAVILGVTGCKNDLTLAEKLIDKGGADPSITYNINWSTAKVFDSETKTVYDKAKEAKTIIIGKASDYSSAVSSLTKVQCGETSNDAVYAYFDSTSSNEKLYVLADEPVVFTDNDMVDLGGQSVGLFFSCESASSIILDNIDTSAMTSMIAMFCGCGITSIDLSKLDTSNVTDMSYFLSYEGGKLESVVFGENFNTSKVTSMESMFNKQTKLKTLDISSFDVRKVTNMNSMFNCTGLVTINLGNFKPESLTSCSRMFGVCDDLKTIFVDEVVDFSSVTDAGDMFLYCNSLVGGMGTKYNDSERGKTYARIDGGSAAPGYFTKKGDSSGDSGESAVLYELDLFGMDIYFGYNKTTCKITNAWLKPDCLGGMNYTLYIPSSSYHDQLLEIDGSKDGRNRDDWGRNGPEGQLLLQIAADSSTASYRLDFIEVITLLQDSGYEYFANIAAAFPDKASPVLPAANTGHDVFYIKDFSDNRYIYDLTNNTVSTIDSSDVSSANNQIVITGDPITLNTKPKTEFPDMTTAVRVSNPCSHQIVIYDDTAELLQIGRVPVVPSNKEEDCCAPLYKTADNKYYQRSGF